jgi:predicted AlkP superfamily pyrophosphatase or phosphodiesterase
MYRNVLLFSLLASLSLSLISLKSVRKDVFEGSTLFTDVSKVVILVLDGPRFSETYGHPDMAYIPYTRDSLMPQGVFFEEFYNNGVTLTVSGHASLTTGRYQRLTNGGQEVPTYPGIFHLYGKKEPAGQRWLVSSKGKLNVLTLTDHKDWTSEPAANSYCGVKGEGLGYSDDHLTLKKALNILEKEAPDMMLINLLDIDVAGHNKSWDQYIAGIKRTDSSAYVIWKAIQENPKMKNKTALFITNDHGRHLDRKRKGFAEHGDLCKGCRKISMLALGPKFQKGKVVKCKYEIIDIAPTIGRLLNFDTPFSKGKSFLNELIQPVVPEK